MDKTEIAKSYLQGLRAYSRKREQLENRLEQINLRILSPATATINAVKVQQTREPDIMGDLLAAKLDIENEIRETVQAECKELCKVGNMIDEIQTPAYSRILSLRYESNKSMAEIAAKLKYTRSYAHKLHNQALAAFYDKYLSESREG